MSCTCYVLLAQSLCEIVLAALLSELDLQIVPFQLLPTICLMLHDIIGKSETNDERLKFTNLGFLPV